MPNKNNIVFHFIVLITCFWISWVFLGFFNYSYSLWYELLDIRPFIQEMAPLNKYRPGLHLLSKDEHVQLFAEINTAIQGQPEILSKIGYAYKRENKPDVYIPLLRGPEVQHLEDVANLVRKLNIVGMLSLIIMAVCSVTLKSVKKYKDHMKSTLAIWVILASVSIVTAITEPVELFYWLHTQVFPEGHQWFFYYQESLMTTLMKAPDLFGAIAVELLLVTAVLHISAAYFYNQAALRLSTKISSNEISAE